VTPPAAAAAHRARTIAPPRPRIAPPRPRRISGPARRPARPPVPAATPQVRADRGLVLGLLDVLAGVARSGALDRLIRGRIWIGVIAFALIGIVTLQLLVLQLNASIGRTLVREAQLQRENAALSIEGSELAAGERVESKAAVLGMELVPVGSLRFLTADPHADVARAAAALNTPVHAAGPSSGSSSGEAGSATATTGANAAAASTAAGEPAPTEATAPRTGEAGASTATEAGSGTGAPASTPTSSSAPTSSSPPSTTAGVGASAPVEAAGAGAVGGAGGVGATQATGAG